jgi:hypothetical protein
VQVTRKDKRVVDPAGDLPGKPARNHAGVEICKDCGAIHYHDRWYLREKLPEDALRDAELHETICPADRQIHDRNPGGVLTLTGSFLATHDDEILNLIHHEDQKARGVNPLERIMEVNREDGCWEITTTNEFLVQRLGRATHSAYSGEIEYKFGGHDVPVRVNWRRDLPDSGNHKSPAGQK